VVKHRKTAVSSKNQKKGYINKTFHGGIKKCHEPPNELEHGGALGRSLTAAFVCLNSERQGGGVPLQVLGPETKDSGGLVRESSGKGAFQG